MPSDTSTRRAWRLLRTPPLDGALNMAVDEALLSRAAHSHEWVVRLYAWSEPTLSVGRHQRALEYYDPAALATAQIPVVRRPTGGRGILHDREVTYSVTGPVVGAGSLRETYARINRVLQVAMRHLGVEAEHSTRHGRAIPPGSSPCFASPAEGEMVVGGRKLVGSAQWRDDSALLQHGSILIDGDQLLVSTLQRRPAPVPPSPATLRDLLGAAPTEQEVETAFRHAVDRCEGSNVSTLEWDDRMLGQAMEFAPRYRDPAWTWRR